jgi:hypothetical protein
MSRHYLFILLQTELMIDVNVVETKKAISYPLDVSLTCFDPFDHRAQDYYYYFPLFSCRFSIVQIPFS